MARGKGEDGATWRICVEAHERSREKAEAIRAAKEATRIAANKDMVLSKELEIRLTQAAAEKARAEAEGKAVDQNTAKFASLGQLANAGVIDLTKRLGIEDLVRLYGTTAQKRIEFVGEEPAVILRTSPQGLSTADADATSATNHTPAKEAGPVDPTVSPRKRERETPEPELQAPKKVCVDVLGSKGSFGVQTPRKVCVEEIDNESELVAREEVSSQGEVRGLHLLEPVTPVAPAQPLSSAEHTNPPPSPGITVSEPPPELPSIRDNIETLFAPLDIK
ncbi:protein of unknown function [Taphrina deformans PYCC 5710]|uniref:Uncharacterized protein n=1 Tax=Taphrina deformans (strain PYCC 5710 / ATCC 11124 / CBS 356.35 / IMI 108563 / JCM 9778 / NBRC 8474) TaxID=1097556 RepID=R4XKU6_TAPDE|nr:protein of unknown function [Taphrina deformans PYCC 5710]|eukprot:CCG85044.1 protein of unknown function [Taphrina deformans PYCC 5710]